MSHNTTGTGRGKLQYVTIRDLLCTGEYCDEVGSRCHPLFSGDCARRVGTYTAYSILQ